MVTYTKINLKWIKDLNSRAQSPGAELALKMSLGSVVIPGLSHTVRDKEMWLRASHCLSVKTPLFCPQNLPGQWRDVGEDCGG